MERMYVGGQTAPEIARHFGCGYQTVHNYLNARGVKKRASCPRRRYHANHAFFDVIDSERKAYWLGFLAADGSVCDKGPRHRVQLILSARDKAHVEQFRSDIGSDHVLTVRNEGTAGMAHFGLNSHEMVKALTSHGVVPCKTYILRPLTGVPDELLRHVFRGYVDGDGCIALLRRKAVPGRRIPCVVTLGTKAWLEWMSQWWSTYSLTHGRVLQKGSERVWQLRYEGRFIAEKVLRPLYEDCEVYLPRKREKYLEIVRLNDELGRRCE